MLNKPRLSPDPVATLATLATEHQQLPLLEPSAADVRDREWHEIQRELDRVYGEIVDVPVEFKRAVEGGRKLAAHGANQHSREEVVNATSSLEPIGRGKAYVEARLDRDAPDLAEKVRAGESDTELLALYDEAVANRPGAGKNQHTECLLDNVQEAEPAPTGNSQQAAIRRLRKERP